MKPLILPVVVIVAWTTTAYGQGIAPGPVDFHQVSFHEAKRLSRAEGKFAFVDFYTDWCQQCKSLEESVYTDPDLGEYINKHFVSIRLNGDTQEGTLLRRFNIQSYPTRLFLDTNGNVVLKQEGDITTDTLLMVANDVINFKTYFQDYQKSNDKPETVRPYARALSWTKPRVARKLVANYLKKVPDKKLSKQEHWDLIRDFVPGTNLLVMDRLVKSDEIRQNYPAEYQRFMVGALKDLLSKCLDLQSDYHLARYTSYVEANEGIVQNADSTVLSAQIQLTALKAPEKLPDLLTKYVSLYEEHDAVALTDHAFYLTDNYFNREVLELAIQWCKDAVRITPLARSYMTMGLAYEKLNQFKTAYAYMLLADTRDDIALSSTIDEHLNRINNKMLLQLNEGVSLASAQGNQEDGRFTLGAGNKRLMYGYPVPSSTSHFIVNIDGQLATNSPRLAAKGLVHLTGYLEYGGDALTPEISIEFEFEGVKITQRLIPVDRHFQKLDSGLAQYYKINYQLDNPESRSRQIGVAVLFDTMIDDNDFCAIGAGDKLLETEWAFTARNMPNQLLFYRTKADTSDMMGTAIINGFGATRPDKMVVGRWPVLHEVTWQLKPKKVKYGDSAYFIKWENRKLNPRAKLSFVTYYGLPDHKKAELRLLVEDRNYKKQSANIFFKTGSSTLDLNAKMQIASMLENQDITIGGVLLNGYADVMGGESYNFELSERRIENVGKIFKSYGIPFMPKPYGNDRSTHGPYNEIYGNIWDRRVEVVIYYKEPQKGVHQSAN